MKSIMFNKKDKYDGSKEAISYELVYLNKTLVVHLYTADLRNTLRI